MINFSKPTGPLLGLLYFFAISILLVLVLFVVAKSTGNLSTYGVNKTVGWAYDACSQVHFTALVSVGTFVLIYLLMMIFRIKIYRIFSIFNFIIVITGTLYLIFDKEEIKYLFFIDVNMFSILFSGIYFLVLTILKVMGVIKNRR